MEASGQKIPEEADASEGFATEELTVAELQKIAKKNRLTKLETDRRWREFQVMVQPIRKPTNGRYLEVKKKRGPKKAGKTQKYRVEDATVRKPFTKLKCEILLPQPPLRRSY